jgi:hypothetical protein
MNRTIGGKLSMDAYGALAGRADADRTRHFRALDPDQQVAAIHRLIAAGGLSDEDISRATDMHADQVRHLRAEGAK